MNAIFNLCAAASFSWALLAAAGRLDSSLNAEEKVAGRPVAAAESLLGSHARSKVVHYFDTYRNDPLGLPPACLTSMRAAGIVTFQNIPGVEIGSVIGETDRPLLIEAPSELVRVLPTSDGFASYWLAGRHLVAVDPQYKVVDSVRIPTVVPLPDETSPLRRPLELVRHTEDGDL